MEPRQNGHQRASYDVHGLSFLAAFCGPVWKSQSCMIQIISYTTPLHTYNQLVVVVVVVVMYPCIQNIPAHTGTNVHTARSCSH
jgi:hypothetical protein